MVAIAILRAARPQPYRITDSYARWRSSRLGRITDTLERQLLARLLGKVDGKKLLDVGCGDGAMALELARQGATVTALDADPSMIAAAGRRAKNEATRAQLVEGDAERLPFDDATFDVVMAVTVLCFVRHAEHAMGKSPAFSSPEDGLLSANSDAGAFGPRNGAYAVDTDRNLTPIGSVVTPVVPWFR